MVNKKAFTLIELLLVVAIISILAVIVVAALTTSRSSGENASVKSNLKSAQNQAEVFYNDLGAGTYVGLCGDPLFKKGLDSAMKSSGDSVSVCIVSSGNESWAASTKLKIPEGTSSYWCVDSRGVSKGETTILVTESCP